MTDLKQEAWDKAIEILESFAIVKSPVPVEKIAKKLGAKVRYSPMDNEDLSGMIFMKEGIPIIGVNALHHPNRQRFTIAHEIGHLVLHKHIFEKSVHVDTKFFALKRDQKSTSGTDDIEIQANAFASELLMPGKFIEAMIDEVFGNDVFDIESGKMLEKLASKFKVSRDAMQFRLMRLMA